MFANLVLAVDGSEPSLRASEQALVLAEKSQGYVYLVYVVDRYERRKNNKQPFDHMSKKQIEEIKQIERKARSKQINVQVIILKGEPAKAILNFANEKAVDLIVVGSRGLNHLQQLVLGSVSYKIMKNAPCSVLIVK
ncbi:universal stress protein [Halalkalibacter akibai]|uniref:Universal stress protein n=1 Tax=Halalkalibacter akibai (strain ATCC 43226 / DSM 21942 / CIP 109018 / JCM 9157 / 1139) TaxID=1236973 RepID=W4QYZ3_HALA3|nr:universal stress protein [Halalkalibacter akibai]GAE36888.1 universal stress protein family [Halalkalibacter akibai JCM 9157]